MAKINTPIGNQAFEVIREQLCAILVVELANQVAIASPAGSNDDIAATVWKERFVPFQVSEMNAINVQMAQGDQEAMAVYQDNGTYTFFIDYYVAAKTTSSADGDSKAMLIAQKLGGKIRAIYMDTAYLTLGFDKPFIWERRVTKIAVALPVKADDATSTVFGRITLTVKAPEMAPQKACDTVAGNSTTVKVNGTQNGFFYDLTTSY